MIKYNMSVKGYNDYFFNWFFLVLIWYFKYIKRLIFIYLKGLYDKLE